MNVISASSAVVHSTQFQTTTQSTYVRQPETPIVPIVDDEQSVTFGARYTGTPDYVGTSKTAGNHVNVTV